jgi:hypothetical protein
MLQYKGKNKGKTLFIKYTNYSQQNKQGGIS